jgi:NAD-dependent dihydropyrimidine dehydrogenase PreA subunit
MIELIDEERCTACNICVRVCPANVFAIMPGKAPAIARQEDCQTCFMCEAYCPADALYVHPNAERPTGVTLEAVRTADLLGSYRRVIGWSKETRARRSSDASYKILTKG